jgi:hypothetical protein
MTGYVVCMGETRMFTKFWVGNLNRRNHNKDLGLSGKIILLILIVWDSVVFSLATS